MRKGGTFTHVNRQKFPAIEITFSSNAQAKGCADELNIFWDDWEKAFQRKRKVPLDYDTFNVMLMTVVKHGGINIMQYKEITLAP